MGIEPHKTTLVQFTTVEFGVQPTGTTFDSAQWRASTQRDLEASTGEAEKTDDRIWIGTVENQAEV